MGFDQSIIINPGSGAQGSSIFADLQQVIKDQALNASVEQAGSPDQITVLARQALDSGIRTITACGGDGTVSAIASVVCGTGRTLGVIPGGTLNHFAKDLSIPLDLDSDVAILGINTARSRAFKNGRINETQVACIQRRFCSLDDRIMKILVTHHPFDLPPQFDVHKLVGRAKMAMRTLARCGADILLAGHFHMSSAGDTTARYSIPGFSALVVQAGTAISTRTRSEANSFNILRIEHPRVVVEPIAWNAASGQFELVRRETFRFGAVGCGTARKPGSTGMPCFPGRKEESF